MEEIIESQQERVDKLLKEAFSIAYESNPSRTEWPLHTIDCDFLITKEEDKRGDVYYACELYLNEEEYGEIVSVTEFLPNWLETYFNGRCSLNAKLTVYTPEKLDEHLDRLEPVVQRIAEKRRVFIAKQSN